MPCKFTLPSPGLSARDTHFITDSFYCLSVQCVGHKTNLWYWLGDCGNSLQSSTVSPDVLSGKHPAYWVPLWNLRHTNEVTQTTSSFCLSEYNFCNCPIIWSLASSPAAKCFVSVLICRARSPWCAGAEWRWLAKIQLLHVQKAASRWFNPWQLKVGNIYTVEISKCYGSALTYAHPDWELVGKHWPASHRGRTSLSLTSVLITSCLDGYNIFITLTLHPDFPVQMIVVKDFCLQVRKPKYRFLKYKKNVLSHITKYSKIRCFQETSASQELIEYTDSFYFSTLPLSVLHFPSWLQENCHGLRSCHILTQWPVMLFLMSFLRSKSVFQKSHSRLPRGSSWPELQPISILFFSSFQPMSILKSIIARVIIKLPRLVPTASFQLFRTNISFCIKYFITLLLPEMEIKDNIIYPHTYFRNKSIQALVGI